MLSFIFLSSTGCSFFKISGSQKSKVWIDTDASLGIADRDVDDGWGLIQAFRSNKEIEVVGMTSVFGNSSLAQATAIAKEIAAQFGPKSLVVFEGASSAGGQFERETAASLQLAARLRAERLKVILLGPATNLAVVLKNHPELASKIDEVIAVAGRRKGQRFTTGTTNPRAHRDFNFEQDPEAYRILLKSNVPITFVPFEVSSKVWVTESDLQELEKSHSKAAQYLLSASRAWLRLWKKTFNVDGFNPFDTLAVARASHPQWLTCTAAKARIEMGPDDRTESRMQGGGSAADKAYLLVEDAPKGGLLYCSNVLPEFKKDLLSLLSAAP
jgi:pyrimidine-specific ribonucleoside hydrolase